MPGKDIDIEFIREVAAEAAALAMSHAARLDSLAVERKSDKDLVTEADRLVEELIVRRVRARHPDHAIMGEEGGERNAGAPFQWMVDPIDGTTSFVHGQPFFSVSIAVRHGGRTEAGVVAAPMLGETWWAVRGGGAFRDGRPIRVSSRARLGDCVMATGFACVRAGREPNNLPLLARVLPAIRDVRRYGSAAIDLCYVASGRLDGFWEIGLMPYDIAAGALIVEEAGGEVRDLRGGLNAPEDGTLATNGLVTEAFLRAAAAN